MAPQSLTVAAAIPLLRSGRRREGIVAQERERSPSGERTVVQVHPVPLFDRLSYAKVPTQRTIGDRAQITCHVLSRGAWQVMSSFDPNFRNRQSGTGNSARTLTV